METLPENISTSPPEEGNAQGRFFFIKAALLFQYFPWKPDSYSQGTDVLQPIWSNQFLYAFPPFCLN